MQQNQNKQILKYLNIARTHPSYYISLLDKLRQQFINEKQYVIQDEIIIQMHQGISVCNQTRKYLSYKQSLPPLKTNQCLQLCAIEHCDNLFAMNNIGHIGLDNSTFKMRLQKHCSKIDGKFIQIIGKDLIINQRNNAQMMILDLIIDDGITKRSDRNAIFSSNYNFVGLHSFIKDDHLIAVFNLSQKQLHTNASYREQPYKHRKNPAIPQYQLPSPKYQSINAYQSIKQSKKKQEPINKIPPRPSLIINGRVKQNPFTSLGGSHFGSIISQNNQGSVLVGIQGSILSEKPSSISIKKKKSIKFKDNGICKFDTLIDQFNCQPPYPPSIIKSPKQHSKRDKSNEYFYKNKNHYYNENQSHDKLINNQILNQYNDKNTKSKYKQIKNPKQNKLYKYHNQYNINQYSIDNNSQYHMGYNSNNSIESMPSIQNNQSSQTNIKSQGNNQNSSSSAYDSQSINDYQSQNPKKNKNAWKNYPPKLKTSKNNDFNKPNVNKNSLPLTSSTSPIINNSPLASSAILGSNGLNSETKGVKKSTKVTIPLKKKRKSIELQQSISNTVTSKQGSNYENAIISPRTSDMMNKTKIIKQRIQKIKATIQNGYRYEQIETKLIYLDGIEESIKEKNTILLQDSIN